MQFLQLTKMQPIVEKLLAVFILTFALASCNTHDWTYKNDNSGPKKWSEKYRTCAGTHQSPISIWLNDLSIEAYSKKNDGILLHHYDSILRNATMVNNGHSVVVRIPPEYHLTLSGGHLPDKYKLVQLHFHWGDNDKVGSEHTIGNSPYPLELHLVHVNMETNQPEAVLGIFYQIVDSESTDDKYSRFMNIQLEGFVKQFQKVKFGKTLTQMDDYVRVSDLLPRNRDDYIYYNGSLTTPPCSEGLHWTIFTQVQNVTKYQIEQFRQLRGDSRDAPIVNNFRPPQSLNDRKIILYTYQPHQGKSSATTAAAIGLSFFIMMIFNFFLSK